MIELNNIKRVFFLGIGGIGMSAVARYFRFLGKEVFGYDRVQTTLTDKLSEEGMIIHYNDDVSMIPDNIDLIVWTPAIPETNLEFQYFQNSEIPMMKRAAVLGLISKETKTIAVAGTHGKTTTSIMLSYLLNEAGVEISAFLGGISSNFNSNFLSGKSDWVVMEADEYDRSFWQLYPEIIILTSMDPDHLDVYGDHTEMIRSYKVFLNQIRKNGTLIYHESLQEYFDLSFLKEMDEKKVKMIPYGMETTRGDQFFLTMPGEHNTLNMTAAFMAAECVDSGIDKFLKAVPDFKGIQRRFEFLGNWNEWELVSDYAHHPQELKAAIQAAKSHFAGRKITGVFQPHLYTRTKDFADGFAEALDALDQPILVELYPARELPIEGVNTTMIVNIMKNEKVIETTKEKLIDKLKELEVDVLLILGAGDLDPMIRKMIK